MIHPLDSSWTSCCRIVKTRRASYATPPAVLFHIETSDANAEANTTQPAFIAINFLESGR